MDRGDWRGHNILVGSDMTEHTHKHTETQSHFELGKMAFSVFPTPLLLRSSSSVLFLRQNTILSSLVGPHAPSVCQIGGEPSVWFEACKDIFVWENFVPVKTE